MYIEEIYNEMNASEKRTFSRVLRELQQHTFIVRDKNDDQAKLYYFSMKYLDPLERVLRLMGYDVTVDKDNGVAMLYNRSNPGEDGIQEGRAQLTKGETIVLCCLWIMYIENLQSNISNKTVVTFIANLQQELEKYGFGNLIKNKKDANDILRKLAFYRLLDIVGNVGEPDCKIKMYTSMQFALDMSDFKNIAQKMKEQLLETETDIEDTEDTEEEDVESESTTE